MTSCSIKYEKLQALVENSLNQKEEALLINHIHCCSNCQIKLQKIFEDGSKQYTISDEEKIRLNNLISTLVRKTERENLQKQTGWLILENLANLKPLSLAAADDQTADQKLLRAVMADSPLSFIANCDKRNKNYWRAEFILPLTISDETQISIRIFNAKGKKIENGTLTFCNIVKPVVSGRCFISISELRKNLKNQSISFCHEGQKDISGHMKLILDDEDL